MKLGIYPKKSRVVSLDQVPSRKFCSVFPTSNIEILPTRLEKIYLLPLLSAVFRFITQQDHASFFSLYLEQCLKATRCRFALGFEPANPLFQDLAARLPEIGFHLFQTGIMLFSSERSVAKNQRSFSAQNVTVYLFGKAHDNPVWKAQKRVELGSLLGNELVISREMTVESKRIVFISQWRSWLQLAENPGDDELASSHRQNLEISLRWAKEKNLPFYVLLRGKNGTVEYEKKYFQELGIDDRAMVHFGDWRKTYQFCLESSMLSTVNSALGFEMIGLGKRVAFSAYESGSPILEPNALSAYFKALGLADDNGYDLKAQLDSLHALPSVNKVVPGADLSAIMMKRSRESQATLLAKAINA